MRVYLIKNLLTGLLYVGQTCQPLSGRWSGHKYSAKRGSSLALHEAIRTYGPEAFSIECLQECSNKMELEKAETYWIGKLNPTRGS